MTRELRDEIRQSRPFQSLEQEAHLSVVRTAAVLSDDFEQLLRPSGITGAQYNVLRILRDEETHSDYLHAQFSLIERIGIERYTLLNSDAAPDQEQDTGDK